MRFEDIKAAVKTGLIKEAGDKEKLYLRLEHENGLNRLARSVGYTGIAGASGVALGSLSKPKSGRSAMLGASGALAGALAANMQNRAERVHELRQLLRMKDIDHE